MDEDAELEAFLESLPTGFGRQIEYGLGFPKLYRPIIDSIEEMTSCTQVEFLREAPTETVKDDIFYLSFDQCESMRIELRRINDRAQTASLRTRRWHAHNSTARLIGAEETDLKKGRHPIVRHLTEQVSGERQLSFSELEVAIGDALLKSTSTREKPEALAKLKQDLDLVNLEALIGRLRTDLDRKTTEAHWQSFFKTNPFALHLGFGYSVIQIAEQASVGGRRVTGLGEKYSDFLVKNAHTNNIGIFEIKRPGSPLLNKLPYRAGIYGPSRDLSSALNQLLDQRYFLTKTLPSIKDNGRDYGLEAYSVRGCVVIGMLASLSEDQKKPFELFRGNSASVEIITFDELLSKLEDLRDVLKDHRDE